MQAFLSLILTLSMILSGPLCALARFEPTVPQALIETAEPETEAEAETAEALDPRIEAMLAWAVATAEDDTHGYSQKNRFGPNYDCSSFVSAALMAGGFKLDYHYSVSGLLAVLPELGFTLYKSSETEARRGDILIQPGRHVEICMGDGACVAAHQDYDGRSGDRSGHEIEYRLSDNEYACSFCANERYRYILRWEGPSPQPAPTEKHSIEVIS